TADGVAGGLVDEDAVAGVAERPGAGGVGADEVAQHGVAAGPEDLDAVAAVGGDHVARADGVAGGIEKERDSVAPVAQGGGTGGVGADVVALDQVPRGASVGDL